ncbi:hypothetical protein bthur0011_19530 [Bacillus thuringiensis serovar huazhongensis BGSC 4BD1]|nr:hypothetical protein bthur0011_19530 [Bacillus thuringiensis serovar huazhongensis BGSC 4BD1]KLA25893.1 hypothetical protein B4080_2533 [Bacillus cereus]
MLFFSLIVTVIFLQFYLLPAVVGSVVFILLIVWIVFLPLKKSH